MAKQLVNPIERHFEKAVLGLAALVLVGSVALYLVTSPNKIDLGGEMVTPNTVDQRVAQKASEVRNRIEQAPSQSESVPDPLAGEFDPWLNPFDAAKVPLVLPSVFAIGPEVPRIDPPDTVGAGLAELAPVVGVGEPVVRFGRTTIARGTETGLLRHDAVNWVTVAVMHDVKAQTAAQQRAYGATRKEVIYGPAELQRRVQRDDGIWSDDDWTNVECWPAGSVPAVPPFQLVETSEGVVVSRDGQLGVDRFMKEIELPLTQMEIIRPLMADYVNGDRWDVPVITTRLDVLKQDDEFLFPSELPSATPADRYAGASDDDTRATVSTEEVSVAKQLDNFEAQIKRALSSKSKNEATLAYNALLDISRNPVASGGERTRAQRLMKDAEQAERDITRWIQTTGATAVATDDEGEKVSRRTSFPTQELWAHDASPGSVKSGRVYQYRIRPTIVNRLLGQPEKLREATDALTAFIHGDWSAPVEVRVPVDTEYYITSQDERDREVSAEFYKWFDGVWVQARLRGFTVGTPLFGRVRTEAPAPTDPTVVDHPEVMFSADATVLDIDFQRAHRERKAGTTRDGVRFDDPKPGCAVVLMDASGRLFERIVETDRVDPRKRAAGSRRWSPPKASP